MHVDVHAPRWPKGPRLHSCAVVMWGHTIVHLDEFLMHVDAASVLSSQNACIKCLHLLSSPHQNAQLSTRGARHGMGYIIPHS